jgi:hypothetical protein
VAGFEQVKLLTGEPRGEYIRRRLQEGASNSLILKEINDPTRYSGPEGKLWPASLVSIEARKLKPKAKADPILAKPATAFDALSEGDEPRGEELGDAKRALPAVPAEYEGILDPEDMAEIRREAEERVRAAQRKAARAELLKKAEQELAREAREAQKRGAARGDLVDVTIDLAPYAATIKLDGEEFYHGVQYRVGRKVAAVLYEQMQRSWQHQDSISGQKQDFNRVRNIRVSGTGGVAGAEGLRA